MKPQVRREGARKNSAWKLSFVAGKRNVFPEFSVQDKSGTLKHNGIGSCFCAGAGCFCCSQGDRVLSVKPQAGCILLESGC